MINTAPVYTRPVLVAFIDFYLAIFSLVALLTLTNIMPHFIRTGTVMARVALAFIDVYFAVLTGNARHTETLVTIRIGKIERPVEGIR